MGYFPSADASEARWSCRNGEADSGSETSALLNLRRSPVFALLSRGSQITHLSVLTEFLLFFLPSISISFESQAGKCSILQHLR